MYKVGECEQVPTHVDVLSPVLDNGAARGDATLPAELSDGQRGNFLDVAADGGSGDLGGSKAEDEEGVHFGRERGKFVQLKG